jgi:hypothetical protein
LPDEALEVFLPLPDHFIDPGGEGNDFMLLVEQRGGFDHLHELCPQSVLIHGHGGRRELVAVPRHFPVGQDLIFLFYPPWEGLDWSQCDIALSVDHGITTYVC